ncbi:MAG TPA: c-type cytochrome [Steroidobacteraceae bacterium]|nr:c-type cytochrome [Steroidobacteraceae bacterium]
MTGLALVLALAASVAMADETDDIAHATARRLAVGVCGTCHGTHGVSELPKFPRLAGQNANYLAVQLKAFRSQTRGDPDAIGYMWGMAGNLEDGTIDALAQYYSVQTAGGSQAGDPALIARGKTIYQQGLESVGVPACAACHGPDAHGMGDFPRLAGQHAQYVLKQLSSFQNNMRNVAVMHGVAQGLKHEEMSAVAAFLEAQP